ncbi:MAG TPA: gliding motility lipoprotein GldH [Phnomibacter sp.]|nr:gliding motility lipoprotein GldH [Phnomibacter sp.]
MRGAGITLAMMVAMQGCRQVALFEQLQNIKGARWYSAQVPAFSFEISDTTKAYNLYIVLRHTNEYPYRNIWLNVGLQQPGDTVARQQQFEVALANAEQWLGRGMTDVYERRALLLPQPIRFSHSGTVTITLAHTMRLDPLPFIMQAGVRLEPVPTSPQP